MRLIHPLLELLGTICYAWVGQGHPRMYYFLRLSFVSSSFFGAQSFVGDEAGVSFVFFLTVVGGATMTGKAGLQPWKRLYIKATAVA